MFLSLTAVPGDAHKFSVLTYGAHFIDHVAACRSDRTPRLAQEGRCGVVAFALVPDLGGNFGGRWARGFSGILPQTVNGRRYLRVF
jgi:hypothetical protein